MRACMHTYIHTGDEAHDSMSGPMLLDRTDAYINTHTYIHISTHAYINT